MLYHLLLILKLFFIASKQRNWSSFNSTLPLIPFPNSIPFNRIEYNLSVVLRQFGPNEPYVGNFRRHAVFLKNASIPAIWSASSALTICTPPLSPFLNVPNPLPPASIWLLTTNCQKRCKDEEFRLMFRPFWLRLAVHVIYNTSFSLGNTS